MKKFCACFSFIMLLFCSTSFAQNDIIATIQVIPPYSPYLSTYVDQPNKVLLTLINTTASVDSVKLWVQIIGDNGVSVTTAAGWTPSQPIVINGYETKPLSFNSYETRDYFDASHVDLVGITKSQLIQNQALPEGNYTICVRVMDYSAPYTLRSMDACATFPISYIDPPVAIQPTCGEPVIATNPQFVLFSWTPPATAPGNIQYEFTLKEVPNTLNPNDVIKNNAFPVLFNTTQTANPTLAYTVAFPQLEAGKKYVWRVKAVDPSNSVQFKNAGYSEACTMIWTAQPVLQLTDGGNNIVNTGSPTVAPLKLKTPANGATVDAVISENTSLYPNHYLFEWYAPTVMNKDTPLMAYHLRIAHVLDGQTPAQALATDSQVVVKTIEGNPTFNYNALGDFTPNQTYAWEVKGVSNVSGGGNVYFSEKWTFQVKKNYGKYKVSGKIDYCYTTPSVGHWSNTYGSIQNTSNAIAESANGTVKATLPYKNALVAFYKAVLVKEGNSQMVAMDGTTLIQINKQLGGKNNYFQDAGELVGIAFTDESGHFEFSSDEVLGNVFDTVSNGKTFHYSKALKVTLGPLGSIYFNNPDEYLIAEGGQNKEQNFHARVKSFKLKVKFQELPKKDYYNKTKAVEELSKSITLYVLREKRYPTVGFPLSEGMSSTAGNEVLNISLWDGFLNQNYEVISKKKTATGTTVTFNDLIVNDANDINDKFFLYATVDGKNDLVMLPKEFRNTSGNLNLSLDDMTFQSSSDWQKAYNKGNFTKSVTIIPDMLISSALSGRLVSHWARTIPSTEKVNNKPDLPLANTKIKLMAYLVKQKDDGTEEVIKNTAPELFATTYTDENGNFKFNVNIFSDSSKYKASTVLGSYPFLGGTLTRVLRVVVDDPYYFSPDNSFVIDGGYEYEVGTLQCNVREAAITGTVIEDKPKGKTIANQRVYLCRWDGWIDGYIPQDEGAHTTVTVPKIYDKDNYEYRVIAETTTDANGNYSFNRLVGVGNEFSTGYKDWPYFVHIQPDELSTNNYLTDYPVQKDFNLQQDAGGLKQFNSEQEKVYPTMCMVLAKPLAPTIRGVIHPSSNMAYTTIDGAKVYLIQYVDENKKWIPFVENGLAANCFDGNLSDALSYLGLDYVQSTYGFKILKTQITGDNGKFQFDNVPTDFFNYNFYYMVWVEKNGFLTEVVKVAGGGNILKGQQFPLYINLRLPVEVHVNIEEYFHPGHGVPAKVIVNNAYSWGQTTEKNCGTKADGYYSCEQEAVLACPIGKVKLYVYPENQNDFLPDSFEVFIKKPNPNSLTVEGVLTIDPIKVRRRKHNIAFAASDKYTNAAIEKVGGQLLGANAIDFEGNGFTQEPAKPTLAQGIGTCSFQSSATEFSFMVTATGANGQPYVPKIVNVHSDPQFKIGTVFTIAKLEPGCTFSGAVKNSNGTGVGGARVYVDEAFTGGLAIEAFTDAGGYYTLKGVPMRENLIIHAVKSANNYIGDKAVLSYKGGIGLYKISASNFEYSKDFTLKECPLDISKILGFYVEATDMLSVIGSGNIKLTGRFVNMKSNDAIKTKDNSHLNFSNIELKAGTTNGPFGKPQAEPVTLPVYTDNWVMPLKLYSKIDALMVSPNWNGIEVNKKTTIIPGQGGGGKGGDGGLSVNEPTVVTNGVITGSILVSSNSFSSGIKFNEEVFTARPKGSANVNFNVFNAPGDVPADIKFGFTVEDVTGSNLRYNLFSRYPDAEADKTTSTLKSGDVLALDTKLHTNLNNVDAKDIELKVGKVQFFPNSSDTYVAGTAGKNITIPLGNWSVTSTDWYLSPIGGLVMKTGMLNTAVSVPFKNMSLTYTDLIYGDFQFDGMTLGGIVPLTIEPAATRSFGFDKGTYGGTWSFIVVPGQNSTYCSSFGDLPGMSGGNKFYVQSIRSFSKNLDATKVELKNDAKSIQLYHIADFQPGSMDVGSDNISMIGAVDYHVPALVYGSNMKLMWKKTNSGVQLQLPDAPTFTLKTKGIKFDHATSDAYTFSDNLFMLKGTLKDEKTSPNNYAFNVELKKTPSDANIKTIGENKFLYEQGGNRGLEHVTGSMSVLGNDWNNFAFNGDMFGMNGGIKNDKKNVSMIIKGDIVADPSNKIGVTGMDGPDGGPLKNMSFVYDFQQQAFVGSAHVGADVGSEHAEIDMELLIGSGQYYVAGAGEITFPPDFWVKKASSAFFAGSVNAFPSKVASMFSNFTYDHSTPPIMNGSFTGIAAAVGVKMPIPKVPEFNYSFEPICKFGVEHEISINMITALNFSNAATLDLNASACAYLHAYAGASIGIGCFNLDASAKVGIAIHGQLNKNGASVSGTAELKLSGEGTLGAGICNSECEAPWWGHCWKDGVGVCFTGEIHANYGIPGGLNMGSDGVGCSGSSCGNQMKCN